MKVLIVENENLMHQHSASANRKLGLIQGLIDIGVEIEYFYEDRNSSKPKKWLIKRIKSYIIFSKNFIYDFFGKYRFENQLINKISSSKPDIIWCNLNVSLMKFLVSASLNYKTALFMELSEFLDIHEVQNSNKFRIWFENRNKHFFEHNFIHHLAGLALMTNRLVLHYSSNFNLEVPLLHLPMTVDFRRFSHLAAAPEEFRSPYIAFVGVMNNIKDGVDILIEGFHRIANDFPKHSLYLVGPWQPDTSGHMKQIEDLGLTSRVFWMKTYPRDTIPAIICNADLLVLPRPDSKQAQGGFPTKLGEYLATGKPVCATTVGEIPDYLADNESVFFAQPGSVDSFADAMRRALVDRVVAAEIGENGRIVAEREFNASIQAKKLNAFFEQLIKEKLER